MHIDDDDLEIDLNDTTEDGDEGTNDDAEQVTLSKADFDAKLQEAARLGAEQALAKRGADDDDDEEELSYDPNAIADRAEARATRKTAMLREVRQVIRAEFAEFDSEDLNHVMGQLEGLKFDDLKNVLKNKQYQTLAELRLGQNARKGKAEYRRKETAMRTPTGGRSQRGSIRGNADVAKLEKALGRPLGEAAKRELMRGDN